MRNEKIVKAMTQKMSKKERKAYFAAQRGSWYGINPVTRTPKNSRAYDRAKSKAMFQRDMA